MNALRKPDSFTKDAGLIKGLRSLPDTLPVIDQNGVQSPIETVDYYGASDCIARSLGMDRPPFTGLKASWVYGVSMIKILPSGCSHRVLTFGGVYRRGATRSLVHLDEETAFIRPMGWDAHAVGAPFLYVDDPAPVTRIPSSVLVVPPHSAMRTSLDGTSRSLPYVEQIRQLKDRFETVVACVGAPDVQKENWIHAFESAGIPWVCGAWQLDRNALVRMSRLFRSFEFMTTNALGSHVFYAAYCGSRVVFQGEDLERSFEDFLKLPAYRNDPLERKLCYEEMNAESWLREKHPYFYAGFEDAPDLSEWAAEHLGIACKRSPEKVADLLGWELERQGDAWAPVDLDQLLTNAEIVSRIEAAVGRKDPKKIIYWTNLLLSRRIRTPGAHLSRGIGLALQGRNEDACEALREEMRCFPDPAIPSHAAARDGIGKLGGTVKLEAELAPDKGDEFERFFQTVRPFSLRSKQQLRSLYELAKQICEEDRPGDFVECGVGAGGSAILLGLVIRSHSKRPRKIYACDTYTGMPDPGPMDKRGGVHATVLGFGAGTFEAPVEFVRENVKRLELTSIVQVVPGWFPDPLSEVKKFLKQVVLLHLDCAFHQSVKEALASYGPMLEEGAVVQVSDYKVWDGCRKALHAFEDEHGLKFELRNIDKDARTFVWPAKLAEPQQQDAATVA